MGALAVSRSVTRILHEQQGVTGLDADETLLLRPLCNERSVG